MPLSIISSEYNPSHQALEIYVAGCSRKCPGCHNPETWDYTKGFIWPVWIDRNRAKFTNPLLKHIWILGGDLLTQHDFMDAYEFLKTLARKSARGLKFWLWTGGELRDVPDYFFSRFSFIKTGRYREELDPVTFAYAEDAPTLTLASSNQKLWQVVKGTDTAKPCKEVAPHESAHPAQ